jgi:dihydrofolate synthase/folylpolyglutamate synthase
VPHNISVTDFTIPGLSFDEAEREISSHIFDRGSEKGIANRVARVRRALDLLGNPHQGLRVVHVTGTNGKTSTSRMTESILRATGLKTGLFTSPHLTTFRERIQINGEPLTQQAMLRLWHDVAPVIHTVDLESAQARGPRMSFFEVLTVFGLVAYADEKVDVAVIEVGIGGERDATNVVTGAVAVLTPIAADHVDIIPGGLPGIAREKSGIIKLGSAVVSATQRDEVAAIINGAASARGASTFWEGAHNSVESRHVVPGGQVLTLRTGATTYPDVFVPLHGDFQAQNALTALSACELLLGDGVPRSIDPDAVAQGFRASSSPGRLEVVPGSPVVIMDSAHNPHGIAALVGALPDAFAGERLIGVVAVLSDKDADGILVGLEPLLDYVVITRTESARATPITDLMVSARIVFGPDRVFEAPSVPTALDLATGLAHSDSHGECGVLVAGSVTLIGEAHRYLRSRLAAGGTSSETVPA